MSHDKMYPRDSRFFVCEQVRNEAGNKLTLLGCYTSGHIVANKKIKDDEPAELEIAFVITLLDGYGKFRVSLDVLAPDERPVFSDQVGETVMSKGKGHDLVFQFRPLQFPSPGTYVVKLGLDESTYKYTFQLSNP